MPPSRKRRDKAKVGAAKNYITRTQAVRKLQISLPDFRRLCIFKGIYPREPRNKRKVKPGATPSTTFYYTKDIQYLFHEPLLAKFREHKALAKKIGRALGRNEVGDAVRLDKSAPRMALDHLVKERYPTFVDALRDLDDALSMLFLFANLPSTSYVPPKTVALCQRLCLEFQHYLIVSRSLRKSFLSIKGIYYQATIQGQDIMWLVPYKFVQKMAGDIDFRIMATFIEFYTTLLGFVNYRLYTTVGLVYPPKFDALSDEQGGELGAFTLEGRKITERSNGDTETNSTNGHVGRLTISATAQAKADKVALIGDESKEDEDKDVQVEENTDGLDTFQPATTQDADILLQPKALDTESKNLFSDLTFFLSRETPKAPLEFILKSFGCTRVGWHIILGDGAFTTDENDARITHQIVDRPPVVAVNTNNTIVTNKDAIQEPKIQPSGRVPGRTYVQPQWVWDSINQSKLLRPDLYAPGASLPPHLSPWIKAKPGAYDPTIPLEQQEKEGEVELFEEQEAEEEEQLAITGAEISADSGSGEEKSDEKDEEASSDENSEDDAGEGMEVDGSESDGRSDLRTVAGGEWNGSDNNDDASIAPEEDHDDQYQRELEAEAAGLPIAAATPKLSSAKRKKVLKEKAEQEELDRQRMMMPNKKRKLFNKMQHGNKKREAEAEKLRMKRRRLEKQGRSAA